MRALDRCRRELKSRLTLAAVLESASRGRTAGLAPMRRAIAPGNLDESDTVVWTEEIAQAFDVVARSEGPATRWAPGSHSGMPERMVQSEAREAGQQGRWVASIGHDASRRDAASRRQCSGALPA